MTLLLTEAGKHGVAMVAESAIRSAERTPFSGKLAFRLAYGGRKVVPVPRLHCAVGIWGMGAVETRQFSFTPDIWIADFLEHRMEVGSIKAVAETLAKEIPGLLKEPDRPFGFQIAGCLPGGEPEFWEATNVDPLGLKRSWTYLSLIEHADALGLRTANGDVRLARGLSYGTGALNDLDRTTSRVIGFASELD